MPQPTWTKSLGAGAREKWSLTVALVIAVTLVFSVLEAIMQLVRDVSYGRHFPSWWARFTDEIVKLVPPWLSLALVVPLAMWLVPWLRRRGVGLRTTLAVHIAVASIFSCTRLTALSLYHIIRWPEQATPLPASALSLISFYFTLDLLFYGSCAGALHAIYYYRDASERERAAAELRANLSEARLHSLRAQLNPHFLFNVMNTIAVLVRRDLKREALDMLTELSDVLRYLLRESPTHEVALRDEIEFASRYLAMEQARFHDRLRIHVDVEHDASEALVPALVLQPLIDNAVRHGVARRVAAELIAISAQRRGEALVLEVRDDGPGPDGDGSGGDERRATTDRRRTGGVGLRNTRARLTQLYGDAQSLELRPADGGGTVATVTLPFHTAPLARVGGAA